MDGQWVYAQYTPGGIEMQAYKKTIGRFAAVLVALMFIACCFAALPGAQASTSDMAPDAGVPDGDITSELAKFGSELGDADLPSIDIDPSDLPSFEEVFTKVLDIFDADLSKPGPDAVIAGKEPLKAGYYPEVVLEKGSRLYFEGSGATIEIGKLFVLGSSTIAGTGNNTVIVHDATILDIEVLRDAKLALDADLQITVDGAGYSAGKFDTGFAISGSGMRLSSSGDDSSVTTASFTPGTNGKLFDFLFSVDLSKVADDIDGEGLGDILESASEVSMPDIEIRVVSGKAVLDRADVSDGTVKASVSDISFSYSFDSASKKMTAQAALGSAEMSVDKTETDDGAVKTSNLYAKIVNLSYESAAVLAGLGPFTDAQSFLTVDQKFELESFEIGYFDKTEASSVMVDSLNFSFGADGVRMDSHLDMESGGKCSLTLDYIGIELDSIGGDEATFITFGVGSTSVYADAESTVLPQLIKFLGNLVDGNPTIDAGLLQILTSKSSIGAEILICSASADIRTGDTQFSLSVSGKTGEPSLHLGIDATVGGDSNIASVAVDAGLVSGAKLDLVLRTHEQAKNGYTVSDLEANASALTVHASATVPGITGLANLPDIDFGSIPCKVVANGTLNVRYGWTTDVDDVIVSADAVVVTVNNLAADFSYQDIVNNLGRIASAVELDISTYHVDVPAGKTVGKDYGVEGIISDSKTAGTDEWINLSPAVIAFDGVYAQSASIRTDGATKTFSAGDAPSTVGYLGFDPDLCNLFTFSETATASAKIPLVMDRIDVYEYVAGNGIYYDFVVGDKSGLSEESIRALVDGVEGNLSVIAEPGKRIVVNGEVVSILGQGGKGLVVNSDGLALTFDSGALSGLGGKFDLGMEVRDWKNESVTGKALVFDMGADHTQFGGAVTVSYTVAGADPGSSYGVYYLADDGTLQPVNSTYDSNTGELRFDTDHFSTYVVYATEKSSDSTMLYVAVGIVAVIAVLAVAAYVVRSRKSD